MKNHKKIFFKYIVEEHQCQWRKEEGILNWLCKSFWVIFLSVICIDSFGFRNATTCYFVVKLKMRITKCSKRRNFVRYGVFLFIYVILQLMEKVTRHSHRFFFVECSGVDSFCCINYYLWVLNQSYFVIDHLYI